jgi:hypothetical protein
MGAKADTTHTFTPPTSSSSLIFVSLTILSAFIALTFPSLQSQGLSTPTCIYFYSLSLFGFFSCVSLIPGTAVLCGEKGLYGRDINKKKSFIMFVILFHLFLPITNVN